MRDDRNNRYSDDRGGFGRRDSERSNFNDRGNSGRGDDRQMFPAVCDNCGKDCEVPFRPNGSKPVFCNDCFRKMGGNDREENSDRFEFRSNNPRENRSDRPEKKDFPRVESRPQNSLNEAYIKQQFDVLNTKMNKIMEALELSKPVVKQKVVEALNEVKSDETPVTEVAEVKVKKEKKAAKPKKVKAE